MKSLSCLFVVLLAQFLNGQLLVRGYLVNSFDEPLPNCTLSIEGVDVEILSDAEGYFLLEVPTQFRKGDLIIETTEGLQQLVPLDFSLVSKIDLGYWKVEIFKPFENLQSQLEWDALFEEDNGIDREQIGSVLQSQQDVFLNTVAFQFRPTFFRLRGLGPRYQEVQLNGIPMYSFFKGSPQWNQWGGLNDFTNRAQQLTVGASSQIHSRGGFLSTTQINLQPSSFRSGSKISQAFSNSSYRFRTQFSVVKRPQENKLGFGLLLSRRWGKQGYMEGTPFEAFSGALLVEKNWSDQHHTWFTGLYTPNSRGKSAPLTKEVFELKGRQYNPYWGQQAARTRNSRIVQSKIPTILINHRWQINTAQFFQFNFGASWGTQTSSRLAYNGHQLLNGVLSGGGRNPDPTYYQYLPSYALRNKNEPDFTLAYVLQQDLINNGELDWNALYRANQTASGFGIYALYDDVQELNRGYVGIQYTNQKLNGLTLRSELGMTQEQSTFFAKPKDLLGATFLWDYNPYASQVSQYPNDLLTSGKKIEVGDVFQYQYGITTANFSASSSLNYDNKGWNVFGRVSGEYRSYQREGFFQNGSYPENSLGKGLAQQFITLSAKGGMAYALTGRHHFILQAHWQQTPPPHKNIYVNPREHQFTVPESTFETNLQLVFSYLWQGQVVNLKANAYALQRKNIQEVSHYFADGIGGDQALFIQEIVQGIKFNHFGLELGVEVELVPELKLVGVLSLGDFRYANNPQVYLGTAPSDEAIKLDFQEGIKPLGKARLKNYYLAGGPQQAASLALHYEDPNFWRLSIFGNYFSRAFLDPNPVVRTANFFSGQDGLPFAEYKEREAKKLLAQEQFPSYFMLNATAGKSWRIGSHYTGFFISLQNVLNLSYITGGYEQGRNANFINLKEDSVRSKPLFSPKYWWGRGGTYFISTYYRF